MRHGAWIDRSERGAIVVHVATALLTFTMLSAFVIDYGIALVSRHQIQSAADAAALAGANALAWDNYSDRTATGPARSAAAAMAAQNRVWGATPSASSTAVSFPACPDSNDSPTQTPIPACVQVDAFRDAAHDNPLPPYVSALFGAAPSGVAARAMAEAKGANATDCLKPIAVPDRWVERAPAPGPWQPASTFERWNPANPTVLLNLRDSYTPPGWDFNGTGLTMNADFGAQVTLTSGSTAIPVSPISPWKYLAVRIPGSVQGINVRANVNQCAGSVVAIGDVLNLEPGPFAANVAAGLRDLINLDPAASWDGANGRVKDSCAQAQPRCKSMSPRLIALAVYDVNDLADHSRFPPGATTVLVSNLVGFFIESVAGNNASGRLTRHPGLINPAAPLLSDAASFLRASLLVK